MLSVHPLSAEVNEDGPKEKSKSSEPTTARVGDHRLHVSRRSEAGRGLGKPPGGGKGQHQRWGSWRQLQEVGHPVGWMKGASLAFSCRSQGSMLGVRTEGRRLALMNQVLTMVASHEHDYCLPSSGPPVSLTLQAGHPGCFLEKGLGVWAGCCQLEVNILFSVWTGLELRVDSVSKSRKLLF